ncbi:MAG: metallopeptidase family protein [Amaricoccus sp.]
MSDPLAAPAPSLADFDELARRAFAALPAEVRRACAELLVRVDDFAPDDILDEMEIEDPYELTGLYDGVALTGRSVMQQPTQPDTVWLYRRPILEEWIDRGDVALDRLVLHVLVHEIAHHLGWSDDDIRDVDDWTL